MWTLPLGLYFLRSEGRCSTRDVPGEGKKRKKYQHNCWKKNISYEIVIGLFSGKKVVGEKV
jgi:hypothetical protein